MIAAAKSRVFHKIFRRYNEWYLLRRAFRSVAAAGSPDPDIAGSRPVLYIMNHSSWWDGLWFYHAIQCLSHADWAQYYVMMEERQLSSFRFFGGSVRIQLIVKGCPIFDQASNIRLGC